MKYIILKLVDNCDFDTALLVNNLSNTNPSAPKLLIDREEGTVSIEFNPTVTLEVILALKTMYMLGICTASK